MHSAVDLKTGDLILLDFYPDQGPAPLCLTISVEDVEIGSESSGIGTFRSIVVKCGGFWRRFDSVEEFYQQMKK